MFLVFGTIDVGRLVYIYNGISSAAREGARIIALRPQKVSDCDPLNRMESVGQAFPLAQDPQSVWNDTAPPNGPTTPPAGQGYIYLYPAVAQDASGDCNAAVGNTRPAVGTVQVQIEYSFQPWTPFINQMFQHVVVTTISVTQTDY